MSDDEYDRETNDIIKFFWFSAALGSTLLTIILYFDLFPFAVGKIIAAYTS